MNARTNRFGPAGCAGEVGGLAAAGGRVDAAPVAPERDRVGEDTRDAMGQEYHDNARRSRRPTGVALGNNDFAML